MGNGRLALWVLIDRLMTMMMMITIKIGRYMIHHADVIHLKFCSSLMLYCIVFPFPFPLIIVLLSIYFI